MAPPDVVHVTPLEPSYPSRLRQLARPPATISRRGGGLEAPRVVAIVGSRDALPAASAFAWGLAADLARADVVVVSGGALGIDVAAHRGALDAGGRTWAVAGTGCEHCFPPEHAGIFERIGAGPGAMVWPFAPDSPARSGSFVARNRVLVALSDAVVVVQAGLASGALNAARCARKMGKPLWVVPVAPWDAAAFGGSRLLLEHGAHPLPAIEPLLASLGLAQPGRDAHRPAARLHAPRPPQPWTPSPVASAVLRALEPVAPGGTTRALHLDEIASRAHSPAPAVAAALLTLALEDVVVEDPPGFFRRYRTS